MISEVSVMRHIIMDGGNGWTALLILRGQEAKMEREVWVKHVFQRHSSLPWPASSSYALLPKGSTTSQNIVLTWGIKPSTDETTEDISYSNQRQSQFCLPSKHEDLYLISNITPPQQELNFMLQRACHNHSFWNFLFPFNVEGFHKLIYRGMPFLLWHVVLAEIPWGWEHKCLIILSLPLRAVWLYIVISLLSDHSTIDKIRKR